MMEEARFWSLIESSRERARQAKRGPVQDFIDLHMQTLAEELRKLSPDEIAAFQERFWKCHAQAYRWNLWGAAYWLHGGCSDDGFIDFRSCLISLGKERFQRALKDPDSLADLIDLPDTPYMQAEGFQYVALKVYEEIAGQEMPVGKSQAPAEPVGKQFDFEDEDVMSEQFPKIVAKFPEMGD